MIVIPNDRSVVRLPEGLVLQRNDEWWWLSLKLLEAKKFLRRLRARKVVTLRRRPRLRVVR